MSDYTPSTDDVRFEYAMHKSVVNSRISENGQGTKLGIHFDEFDRWLQTVKAEAWDEGFDSGHYVNDDESRDCDCRNNPYTKENNA